MSRWRQLEDTADARRWAAPAVACVELRGCGSATGTAAGAGGSRSDRADRVHRQSSYCR
jgi:hypothetical protein